MLSLVVFLCVSSPQIGGSPNIKVSYAVDQRVESGRIRIKLVTPVFDSTAPVAKLANREARNFVRLGLDSFLEASREAIRMIPRPDLELFRESVAVVSIAKRDFISLYIQTFDYAGGAHPNLVYKGATWGLKQGVAKRLTFADLLPAGEEPLQVANRLVVPRLVQLGATWFAEGERDGLTEEEVDNFVVTPAGVTWLFSPYEAGPYVQGEFFVKVPWSELPGHPASEPPICKMIPTLQPRMSSHCGAYRSLKSRAWQRPPR